MKFCFYGSIANGLKGKPIGGGEQQLALLTKTLVILGHDVIVLDFINEEDEYIEGVKIKSLKMRLKRGTFLKIFYKELKATKADIYYARIRSSIHLVALYAAYKQKAKFVYHLASDLDSLSFNQRWKGFYSKLNSKVKIIKHIVHTEILFPVILGKADLIITQNEEQFLNILNKGYKDVIKVSNLFEPHEITNPLHIPEKPYFLFVGSLDSRKGVVELEEIINKCENNTFYVIGKPRDKYGETFISNQKLINIVYLGHQDHGSVIKYLSNSIGLLNTSMNEGFSNAFIEAWSVGKPVISLNSNPSKVLNKHNLGIAFNGNVKKMIDFISNYKPGQFNSKRITTYVSKNHACINNTQIIINKIKAL